MIANNENPTKETMRFPSYMTLGKSIKTAEVSILLLLPWEAEICS